jgi:hypothetical protein
MYPEHPPTIGMTVSFLGWTGDPFHHYGCTGSLRTFEGQENRTLGKTEHIRHEKGVESLFFYLIGVTI